MTMSRKRKEGGLVLRAQAGDREALDEVLRWIQGGLFAHLRRMLRNTAEAEDALQDTLLLVCRKLRWLREPSWFRATASPHGRRCAG